jgi:O-antigen/teichoic acid export membrane protein
MTHAHLAHRALHATWWSALEIAARYGVQLMVMILLARLLTPADFGLIAMLLVFTTVAALLVDSGFGTALVQKQRTSDDDETTVFLSGLAISVLVGGALWLAAPVIAAFYAQPRLVPLTRLLVWVLPLSAFAAVPDALLTQRLDFRARAKAEIIASLCSGTLAVILAWLGFGVWSLAWQSIAAIGMRAMMLWLFSRWRPRGHFRTVSFRGLFGFGSYMLMANLLDTLSVRVQALLIGKFFDSRTLGYYTLAQNTQQAPALLMSGVLNRVGLPIFTIVSKQPGKMVDALRRSLRIALFVFVPCMIGIAVTAKSLVIVLYGARWLSSAPVLSVLALSAVFWPTHLLYVAAVNATGRSHSSFRLALVKRTITLALVVASGPFGPMTVAWAVLASSIFGMLINSLYASRLLGYRALDQIRDQFLTGTLSTLAALAAWLASHWVRQGAAALIIAVATAAVVYIVGAALAKHQALTDLLGLLRAVASGEASRSASTDGFDA